MEYQEVNCTIQSRAFFKKEYPVGAFKITGVNFEAYFLDGQIQKEINYYYGNGFLANLIKTEFYFLNDVLHNEKGPACIHYFKNENIVYYYLLGNEISQQNWKKQLETKLYW